ncbi:MAG: DUF2470 domain-containing protein [Pseudomonadota bacterium]
MPSTTDDLTEQEKRAIIEHMNADHADACLLYAQVHAERPEAESAQMVDVTLTAMTLEVVANQEPSRIALAFHRPATDRGDVRAVLVEMVKTARQAGNEHNH